MITGAADPGFCWARTPTIAGPQYLSADTEIHMKGEQTAFLGIVGL